MTTIETIEGALNPQGLAPSRVFKVIDAEHGKIIEQTAGGDRVNIQEALIPYPRDHYGALTVNEQRIALREAGPMHTSNFPDLLRQGLRFDAFTSYTETPTIWQRLVRQVNSTKQQEEYLKDVALGMLPVVPEGTDYPEASINTGASVIIRNYKRGMIVSVTEEMQRFDQVGKVRQLGELMGRAARLGEEKDVLDVLTTTTNYTRTNTAGDNDETATGAGANTQTLTFSAASLITAFNILRTMKDRTTGVNIGVMPNTLIVTPKLWWAAQQLLQSPETQRVGDAGSAAETYGTGTRNSFFSAVDTIIVSQMMGNGYQWILGERGRGLTFQRVDPIQILFQGREASNEDYFNADKLKYRVRNWYGVGFDDDRYWFYSDSTTAPAIS